MSSLVILPSLSKSKHSLSNSFSFSCIFLTSKSFNNYIKNSKSTSSELFLSNSEKISSTGSKSLKSHYYINLSNSSDFKEF